ncbi:DUF1622 domain-containing protein [Nocardia sp. NPDC058518]|uniref:DUF1622 domain-containing protein n=1 Tax=Nocardia sp. NPDC058518 TaxID=3346534 RepID=UPI003661EF62
MQFTEVVETAGQGLDAAGVAAIVIGGSVGTIRFLRQLSRHQEFDLAYRAYRRGLGRAILLGLEFLVAADIIRTVAISPTFTSVGVLALIVLVRTFLSYSLELELTGQWPWQRTKSTD